MENTLSTPPLGDLARKLGIEILALNPRECRALMPVSGNTQAYGYLHGGASAALAETIGSLAADAHARSLPGQWQAVGIELNISHHRPRREGAVLGRATALHLGQRQASYLIEITQAPADSAPTAASAEPPKVIASARLTCALIPRPAQD